MIVLDRQSHHLKRWGCFFIILFSLFSPLLAQEEKTEKIEVEASPLTGGEKGDSSSFSTILHLDKVYQHFKTLPEILSRTEGVTIRQFGGLGKLSTISIRGSSAQQVRVFLDGFPLNTAQNGSIDFSNIPLSALSRVEILRGGDGSRFGSGSMGGSVHLITKPLKKSPKTALSLTYGSWGTSQIQFSRVEKLGKFLEYLFSMDLFHTNGDFNFSSEGVKIGGITLGTREELKRENNRSQYAGFLTRVRRQLSSHWEGSLLQELFFSHKGIPGLEAFPLREAHQEDFRSLSGLSLKREKGDYTLIPKIYFRADNMAFSDPRPSLGLPIKSSHKNFSYGGDFLLKCFLSTGPLEHNLIFSLLFKEDLLRSSEVKTSLRDTFRALAQDEMTFFKDRAALVLGVAWERASDYGDEWSARTGGRLTFPLGENHSLTLQANLRRSFRFPEFNELYYPNLGFVRGNPDLRPEQGIDLDGGLKWIWKGVSGQGVVFFKDLEDSISWVNISPTAIAPLNTGRVRSWGVETSLSLKPCQHFSILGAYTFLDARLQPTGTTLPGRPKHSLKGKVLLSWEKWTLFGEVQYSSTLPTNIANTIYLREYFQIDGGLSFPLGPQGRISLEVKNLLDSPIRDVRGFPLPGRSFFVKISFSF